MTFADADEVRSQLLDQGYLSGSDLATAVYLASVMNRPLLLEGEPGTGKTSLSESLSAALNQPLVRLQCYEGIDTAQAMYEWDFPKQILHLRSTELGTAPVEDLNLYSRDFLLTRPLLAALELSPAVLLIDEVDRSDPEFEALLLEVLATQQITIPEIGTVKAAGPLTVVLTSNRTRELHDAVKRRCLYHWIDHPSFDEQLEIIKLRLPEVSQVLAEQVTEVVSVLRESDLRRVPGVAETLDWALALHHLAAVDITPELARRTRGALLKDSDDMEALERVVAAERLG